MSVITKGAAALAEEVQSVLSAENTWMSAHALLQKCSLAVDGDQLGGRLLDMAKLGKIQRCSGPIGLLYAAPGVPKLPLSTDPGAPAPACSMKAKNHARFNRLVERGLRKAGDEPVAAPAAETPAQKVERSERREQIYQRILAVLAAAHSAAAHSVLRLDIQRAIGLSQSETSRRLLQLEALGRVERTGETNKTRWRIPAATPLIVAPQPLAQDPAVNEAHTLRAPAPPAPAPIPPPVEFPAAAAARFAFWSTGEFEVVKGAVHLVLPLSDTRALFQFIESAGRA